jgi:hypothetical protein
MININKILLEEKNRILELHKTATKNHYLMEDAPGLMNVGNVSQTKPIYGAKSTTSFKLDGEVSLENKNDGGSELKLFKGTTFNIGNKGILYANTNWQKVGDLMGSVEGSGRGNIYYTCSSGKFSIGTEQKLPPCVNPSDKKCKNLFYNESYPTLTQKVLGLCKASQTFVKGKPTENKPENNKNTEEVKTREVKVKSPEVKSVVQPVVQTPEDAKIVSDVDNYDEAALAKIAAEIQ